MPRKSVETKIREALDVVRPHLQMDGGNVEFVAYDSKNKIVSVKLQGACHGCPMAEMTLQNGIGRIVKQKVKEVKEVVAV